LVALHSALVFLTQQYAALRAGVGIFALQQAFGLFQGKNAHPCPHGSILFHEENQFFMQGHQLHSVFLLAPELFLCLHTPHFRNSIE
jgi:hypothetical protein